jgi:hypothetical protein
MDIVTKAVLILFGSSMLFSGGVCFGAWWATRDKENTGVASSG